MTIKPFTVETIESAMAMYVCKYLKYNERSEKSNNSYEIENSFKQYDQ